MKCKDIEEQLSAYIDNELSKEDKDAVEQHVADCAACAKSLAQLKHVTDMVGDLEPVTMSDEATTLLESAIEERLRAPEPKNTQSEKLAWWRWFTRPAFGAVAASVAVLALAVIIVSSPVQQNTDSMSELQKRTQLSAPGDREEKISPKIGAGRAPLPSESAAVSRQSLDSLAKKLNEQPPSEAENYSLDKALEPQTEPGFKDDAAKKSKRLDAAGAASIASKNAPFKLLSDSISTFEDEEAWIITFEALDKNGGSTGHFRAAAVSTDGHLLYRTK